MRRLAVGLVLLVVALVVVPSIYADPAIVIKNDGICGMPGADADGNLIFGGLGIATTIVENDNRIMLKCKGDGITNDSGRGQVFRGFLCGAGGSLTTDSHATVSASGVSTLTCSVDK